MPVPYTSNKSCVCRSEESEISLCSYHKQQRSQPIKLTKNNVDSKTSITIKKSVNAADDQAWAEILHDLRSISKVISNTDNKNKQQCYQDNNNNIGDLSNVKSITIKISRTGTNKSSSEKANTCRPAPGKTKPCREAINEVRMDFVKRLKQAFEECNCTSCHCLGDMFEPMPTTEKESYRKDSTNQSESKARPTPKTTSSKPAPSLPAPSLPAKLNTGANPETEGVYEVMCCNCQPCECEQCQRIALLKSAHAQNAACSCKTDNKTMLELYPSGVFTFPQYKKEFNSSMNIPANGKTNYHPCSCKKKAQERTISQQVYNVHTTLLDKNYIQPKNGSYYPNPQKNCYSLSSPYKHNKSSMIDNDDDRKSIEDKSTLCQLMSIPHNDADVSVVVLMSTSSKKSTVNNKRVILSGHRCREVANSRYQYNAVDILKKSILKQDVDTNLSEDTVISKNYSDRYKKEFKDLERDSYYSCKTFMRQEESTNVLLNDSQKEKLLSCKSSLSEIITNIREFQKQLTKTMDKFEMATLEVKRMTRMLEARTLHQ